MISQLTNLPAYQLTIYLSRSLLSPPLRRFQMRLSPDATLVARADFTEESMQTFARVSSYSSRMIYVP